MIVAERWVVLDVETSGLDPRSDHLLAIAAIAIRIDWSTRNMAVALADSFEVSLRPPRESDRANVLLHGIGHGAQRTGLDPEEALESFLQFVGDSPLLAFHTAFDQTVLERALKTHKKRAFRNAWVDIEHLCQVTAQGIRAKSLDEWMQALGVRCLARHKAAADTLAECEVLLRIWPELSRQCRSWVEVQALAKNRRWLLKGHI
jgi:DNA polymerase III subunit epsilon